MMKIAGREYPDITPYICELHDPPLWIWPAEAKEAHDRIYHSGEREKTCLRCGDSKPMPSFIKHGEMMRLCAPCRNRKGRVKTSLKVKEGPCIISTLKNF